MLTISITGVPAVGTEHSAVFSLKPPASTPRACINIHHYKKMFISGNLPYDPVQCYPEGSSYRPRH